MADGVCTCSGPFCHSAMWNLGPTQMLSSRCPRGCSHPNPHCFRRKLIFWAPHNPRIYFQRFPHSVLCPESMFLFQHPRLIWLILCGLKLSHIILISAQIQISYQFFPYFSWILERKLQLNSPFLYYLLLKFLWLRNICKVAREPPNVWFPVVVA